MSDFLLNQWHCDDVKCGKIFFVILEEDPKCCPFCHCEEISDSKVLEAKTLSFR